MLRKRVCKQGVISPSPSDMDPWIQWEVQMEKRRAVTWKVILAGLVVVGSIALRQLRADRNLMLITTILVVAGGLVLFFDWLIPYLRRQDR